jgi:hypothetical protein
MDLQDTRHPMPLLLLLLLRLTWVRRPELRRLQQWRSCLWQRC